MSRPRICLVTPAHLASNPRLVKEADALQAAGYEVHVVAHRYFPVLDSADATLYSAASWARTVVDTTRGPCAFFAKLLRRLARRRLAAGATASPTLASRAHHAAIPALAAAAARVRADLYIGHCLAGLAAAGLAAHRVHARLGFDAEDFHPAETRETETDPVEIASIRAIESTWLPRCSHLTASSPLIGAAYAKRYGIRNPVTLLNVFPLAEAPASPVSPESAAGNPPLLYWFSQTIGPGRGLEPLVGVLGRLKTPCALRLRGLPSPDFPDTLRALARAAGFSGPITFEPLGPPQEMMTLAASADLGLSLEQSSPLNRDLCLTNKVFTYLLAGVPVALTPTSAQLALAPALGGAGLYLDLNRPAEAAATLDTWLGDPVRRAAARSAAWRLGRELYHWEHEIPALLSSVETSLASPPL